MKSHLESLSSLLCGMSLGENLIVLYVVRMHALESPSALLCSHPDWELESTDW